MEKIVVVDEKYKGMYVAFKGPDDTTVVGAGKDPDQALAQAKKQGQLKPYIIYIPEKEKGLIYQ